MAAGTLALQASELKSSLARCDQLTGEAAGVLDQYMQRIDDLDRIIQPVAARTQTLTQALDNIKKAREKADLTLQHLDTAQQVEGRIRAGPRADLDAFLSALVRLEASIAFFQRNRRMVVAEDAMRRASGLRHDALQIPGFKHAMQAAANDFWAVLRDYAAPPPAAVLTQQAFADGDIASMTPLGPAADLELIPQPAVARLRRLGEAMLRNGEKACYSVYVESRGAVMDKALQALGNDYTSKEEFARLTWPALEKKIQGWIVALRVMMRMIMAESRLADGVFAAPYDEAAFSEVVGRSIGSVAAFGEGIIHGRRAPEKVFGLMDMHENLDALLPTLTDMIDGTKCGGLLSDFRSLNQRLRQEARATFKEFEASIARDSNKHVVTDGTVHPLAAYTLGFLKRLFTYESSILVLFSDAPDAPPGTLQLSMRERSISAAQQPAVRQRVADALQRVLDTLIANLDAKTKTYKNKALAALFMMNNEHFMVKTVEGSEALMLLGPDWLERQKDKVEEWGEAYQALSWGPLIELVKADLQPSARKDKTTVKERFKTLNGSIAAIHESQSGWTVPDATLRANLKDAIGEDFLQPYGEFLQRGAGLPGRTADKYVKYSLKDVHGIIQNDLFEMKDELSGPRRNLSVSVKEGSQRSA